MVVGDVRQYFAAALPSGAAFHRFPAEFPDTAAQKDVLHSYRVYMTNYCEKNYRSSNVILIIEAGRRIAEVSKNFLNLIVMLLCKLLFK